MKGPLKSGASGLLLAGEIEIAHLPGRVRVPQENNHKEYGSHGGVRVYHRFRQYFVATIRTGEELMLKNVPSFRLDLIKRDRQRLEIELASKLYAAFSAQSLLGPIKHLALQLLVLMENVEPEIVYQEYACAPYRMKRLGPAAPYKTLLQRLQRSQSAWDLADCSDIIRLFGEVVEKVKTIKNTNISDEAKGQYRLKHMFDKQSARLRMDLPVDRANLFHSDPHTSAGKWSVFLQPHPNWRQQGLRIFTRHFLFHVDAPTKQQAEKNAVAHFARDKQQLTLLRTRYPNTIPNELTDQHFSDKMAGGPMAKVTRGFDEHEAVQQTLTERAGKMDPQRGLLRTTGITPGMERYEFKDKSAVRNMNVAFGLKPQGGDISGTTTDSMYAIDVASLGLPSDVAAEVTPIRYVLHLLPLVTMVYQGHHALLECGLSLSQKVLGESRNKFGQQWMYCIGYYTTLWPKDVDRALGGGVYDILQDFETAARSRNGHVLIWTESGSTQNRLMEKDEEIEKFKAAANVQKNYEIVKNGLDKAGANRLFSLANLKYE